MNNSISPIPQKSPVVDKEFMLQLDWLRWFRDVTIFILRLLNSYDSNRGGIATLTLGTVIVANTTITATKYIRLTVQTITGTPGFLSVVLNPGVGFTINSASALDNSVVFYEIVEAF